MGRRIRVKVFPDSGMRKVEESGDVVKVWLKEKAEGGRANAELVEILQSRYGCRARIVKGFRKRTKILELYD